MPITNGTLPHEVISEFKSAKVLLKPASPGTGIIAGPATRAILEYAGVRDALTKCLSSRNMKNIAEATMLGLKQLKDINEVARLRDMSVEELLKKTLSETHKDIAVVLMSSRLGTATLFVRGIVFGPDCYTILLVVSCWLRAFSFSESLFIPANCQSFFR